MKTTKMSLANIQGRLSRTEMKNIMAGSGTLTGTRWNGDYCYCDWRITVAGITTDSCNNPCGSSYCGH